MKHQNGRSTSTADPFRPSWARILVAAMVILFGTDAAALAADCVAAERIQSIAWGVRNAGEARAVELEAGASGVETARDAKLAEHQAHCWGVRNDACHDLDHFGEIEGGIRTELCHELDHWNDIYWGMKNAGRSDDEIYERHNRAEASCSSANSAIADRRAGAVGKCNAAEQSKADCEGEGNSIKRRMDEEAAGIRTEAGRVRDEGMNIYNELRERYSDDLDACDSSPTVFDRAGKYLETLGKGIECFITGPCRGYDPSNPRPVGTSPSCDNTTLGWQVREENDLIWFHPYIDNICTHHLVSIKKSQLVSKDIAGITCIEIPDQPVYRICYNRPVAGRDGDTFSFQ